MLHVTTVMKASDRAMINLTAVLFAFREGSCDFWFDLSCSSCLSWFREQSDRNLSPSHSVPPENDDSRWNRGTLFNKQITQAGGAMRGGVRYDSPVGLTPDIVIFPA